MKAEFAVGCLKAVIPLSRRNLYPFEDQLEMVGQPFDVVVDRLFGGSTSL